MKKNKSVVKKINSELKTDPETMSKKRMAKIKDGIFEAINESSMKNVDQDGEVTINEVVSVLNELAYSYNSRNLKSTYAMIIQSKKEN